MKPLLFFIQPETPHQTPPYLSQERTNPQMIDWFLNAESLQIWIKKGHGLLKDLSQNLYKETATKLKPQSEYLTGQRQIWVAF
jgi:hypothetical protein